jgi:hypothetical protein
MELRTSLAAATLFLVVAVAPLHSQLPPGSVTNNNNGINRVVLISMDGQYLRVNTMFEVVKANGGYTA